MIMVFKCKMCGGSLNIIDNESTIVCEYCGTKQTLPRLDDDRRANLYDRANHFRRNNDYDKAMGIYEHILDEDNTDAEAYWSILLCRYGIEYVEDPDTHKRVPTCNRTQFTSIYSDQDYKSAIEHADASQKMIYEEEAAQIDSIQKGILEISRKEEPFDIFVCYKETDNQGRRTQDSVLAQDIYYQLQNEGYKVFFSRITLEDKLGTAYEPYIFAALNSARIMIVVSTKSEYVNAVWVRNEWSRYLSLINSSNGKTLIPAYKDMDPYDLPEEFSHLQALDMSKLGFMQDLIRGIRKLLNGGDKEKIKETVVVGSSGGNVESLLKRTSLFLEDEEWKSAIEYAEKVLDMDPENGYAYFYELMATCHIKDESSIIHYHEPIENNKYYKKALRFADDNLKNKLIQYNDEIIRRIEEEKRKKEEAEKEKLYQGLLAQMQRCKTEAEYKKTSLDFEKFGEYKDSYSLAKECLSLAEKAKEAENEKYYDNLVQQKQKSKSEEDFIKLSELFRRLEGFRDSDSQAEDCLYLAENAKKDVIYSKANALVDSEDKKKLQQSIEMFSSIKGYKNSEEKILFLQSKIEDIDRKEEERIKKQEEERRENERLENERRKRNGKIAFIVGFVAAIVAIFLIVIFVVIPKRKYNDAKTLMDSHSYLEAIDEFQKLGAKKYSAEIEECKKQYVSSLEESGDYNAAKEYLMSTMGKDSASDEVKECDYLKAIALLDDGKYDEAIELFQSLGDYKDSKAKIQASKYKQANDFRENGDLTAAIDAFTELGDYEDSKDILEELQKQVKYEDAISEIDDGAYADAVEKMNELGDYKDAKKYVDDYKEKGGEELYNKGQYLTCINYCKKYYVYSDFYYESNYNYGMHLYENGSADTAVTYLKECTEQHPEVEEIVSDAEKKDKYDKAVSKAKSGMIDEAIELFSDISGYKDSSSWLAKCNEVSRYIGTFDSSSYVVYNSDGTSSTSSSGDFKSLRISAVLNDNKEVKFSANGRGGEYGSYYVYFDRNGSAATADIVNKTIKIEYSTGGGSVQTFQ